MKISAGKMVAVGTALVLSMGLAACSGDTKVAESDQSAAATEQSAATAPAAPQSDSAKDTKDEGKAAAGDLYTSTDDNFKVALPSEPVVTPLDQSAAGVNITGNVYTAQVSGESGYVISVSKYEMTDPNSTWDDRASLDGAISGMVGSTGGTLESSSNDGELLGYPAASAVISSDISGKKYETRSQLIMRDQTLYNLLALGVTEEEFQAFVDSFSFLD